MPSHLLFTLLGTLITVTATLAAVTATRVRLLPDVIDVSIIPTGAGVGSLTFASFGALRRFDPDRLGRVTLFGTLLGGAGTTLGLAIALAIDVLS